MKYSVNRIYAGYVMRTEMDSGDSGWGRECIWGRRNCNGV